MVLFTSDNSFWEGEKIILFFCKSFSRPPKINKHKQDLYRFSNGQKFGFWINYKQSCEFINYLASIYARPSFSLQANRWSDRVFYYMPLLATR